MKIVIVRDENGDITTFTDGPAELLIIKEIGATDAMYYEEGEIIKLPAFPSFDHIAAHEEEPAQAPRMVEMVWRQFREAKS